jgi:3-oxoacyl-[acyl-carrier protein] reductase
MGVLDGKTCVITGASRGLGAEIARLFWSNGANLFLVARTETALKDLIASLPVTGAKAVAYVSDLSSPTSANYIAAAVKKEFNKVDILINNAAVHGTIGPFSSSNESDWEKTFTVNFFTPTRLVRECIPLIPKGGKIIFLSGGGATGPRVNFSAYGVAKTAIVRFAENLAKELLPEQIDVNCISPGTMPTKLLKEIVDIGLETVGSNEYLAAKRVIDSTDDAIGNAAKLALYLASSDGDNITGKLISAVWDPWKNFIAYKNDLQSTDIYTLRRISPEDRDKNWSK